MLYKFANRRQLGYLIDSIIFLVPSIIIILMLNASLRSNGTSPVISLVAGSVAGLSMGCICCLRDGVGGRSPGKWVTNLQVLNEVDHQPISWGQSFKRNAVLLVAHIPVVSGFAVFVVIIILAVQVGKGYRLGDGFAQTRVIWSKYIHSSVFRPDGLVCTGCGYSLLGNTSGVCPECGKAVASDIMPAVSATVIDADGAV